MKEHSKQLLWLGTHMRAFLLFFNVCYTKSAVVKFNFSVPQGLFLKMWA